MENGKWEVGKCSFVFLAESGKLKLVRKWKEREFNAVNVNAKCKSMQDKVFKKQGNSASDRPHLCD